MTWLVVTLTVASGPETGSPHNRHTLPAHLGCVCNEAWPLGADVAYPSVKHWHRGRVQTFRVEGWPNILEFKAVSKENSQNAHQELRHIGMGYWSTANSITIDPRIWWSTLEWADLFTLNHKPGMSLAKGTRVMLTQCPVIDPYLTLGNQTEAIAVSNTNLITNNVYQKLSLRIKNLTWTIIVTKLCPCPRLPKLSSALQNQNS